MPVGEPSIPVGESGEGAEPPAGTASAQAENFGGAPAAVLLSAAAGVDREDAEQCVGVKPTAHFGGFGEGAQAGSLKLELAPGGAMPSSVSCPTAAGTTVFPVATAAPSSGGVVSDPIDPKYLTEVPFGKRSFWIQPWRSYLDTWPASRLLNAVGINFNVTPAESEGTARLLSDSGVRLARIEVSWNQFSYEDPTTFVDEAGWQRKFTALREHGLRPLILLNSNSGGPGPARSVTLETTAPAAAGATTVSLSSASAAAVVPGKTGFDDLSFGGAPDVLITAVDGNGQATLSQPLAGELSAGLHQGATLRYGPFSSPELSNGSPNPLFQETLKGWLEYVGTVCRDAEAVFGPGGYDLEVWNELSFGSQFLYEGKYYSPPRVSGAGSVTKALLEKTVEYVRDPAHGISAEVGISDGFASETPFASGGTVPAGTTALSKHLYAGTQYFPRNQIINSILPLNALGGRDSTDPEPPYTPNFTPAYVSALPEYFLTATQTETEVRDLSPETTTIYGVPHGRNVAPSDGVPPQTWMTEYNLNTNTLFPQNAEEPDHYIGALTAEQKELIQAEIVLRSLVAMVSKGMTREYLYAAAHSEGYSLISEAFMKALDANPASFPGDSSGGPTTTDLQRMLARFQGPGPGAAARQLRLLSIAQQGNHAAFSGDGTAAHPDLYDRELLAVFPFQSSPTRFVVPVYVMTPNLITVGNPLAPESSLSRFDLPENFRITLGNLPETANPPTVSAYDPITDTAPPARFVSGRGDEAIFEIQATDYPRLLTIEY